MMTEQEIFEHLFTIADQSDDTGGVVSSCLVRQGNIVVEGISCNDGKHAEYVLLRQIELSAISILPDDIIYTTVESVRRLKKRIRGRTFSVKKMELEEPKTVHDLDFCLPFVNILTSRLKSRFSLDRGLSKI